MQGWCRENFTPIIVTGKNGEKSTGSNIVSKSGTVRCNVTTGISLKYSTKTNKKATKANVKGVNEKAS
jgi:hypothetical protein